MDRFMGLDTLMASNGLTSAAAFDVYYQTILEGRENMDLNIEGFEWDDPQIDFTYEMLETGDEIYAMAHYVDLNSPALPSGKQTEFAKLTGSIPRQKYRIVRGENDYRKELIVMQEVAAVARFQGRDVNTSLSQHLAKYLFNLLVEIPEAHKNSLNYQVGQMKSAAGLILTDENNPRGIKNVKFEANVPASNFITKQWLTKDAEGVYTPVEGANPIEDLKAHNRQLRWSGQYDNIVVELDEQYAFELFKLPEVLKAIGYAETPNLRLSAKNDDNAMAVAKNLEDDAIKEHFRRLIGANRVVYHNTIVAAEKLNAEKKNYDRKKMKAFNADVVLVRPEGTIGKIKTVVPLRPDGSAVTAGIFEGRGLIEYIYNAQTRTQDWQSELTVLAVPTRPRDMFYFKGVADASAASAE